MIVDTSACVAILRKETGYTTYLQALDSADVLRMSAATYLELATVIDGRRDPVMSRGIDNFLEQFNIRIEPVTVEQAQIARQAYRDYGRGSGHPANLNFGDCFTYALARTAREPILYKGDDFNHTELRSAL